MESPCPSGKQGMNQNNHHYRSPGTFYLQFEISTSRTWLNVEFHSSTFQFSSSRHQQSCTLPANISESIFERNLACYFRLESFTVMKVSDEIIEVKGSEVEAVYGLAKLLNTGLDRRVLAILLELLECGVHPDSLVDGMAVPTNYFATPQLISFAPTGTASTVVEELRK